MVKRFVCCVALASAALSLFGAGTYYAKPDGTDDATCADEANAGSLVNALQKLKDAKGGTVYLADGTYDYASSCATGQESFFTNSVSLTLRSLSDDRTKVTIKGGGREKPVRFLRMSAIGLTITMRGITFSGCSSDIGGVYYALDSESTITNCVFTNCYASSSSGCLQLERENTGYNTVKIHDSVFVDNYAEQGNSCFGGKKLSYNCYGCTFLRNDISPTATGGYNCSSAGGNFEDCLIVSNVSSRTPFLCGSTLTRTVACYNQATNALTGGGVFYHGGNMVVTDCAFTNNTCNMNGGVCYNDQATGSDVSNFYRTEFVGNKSPGGYGAFYVRRFAHFYDCTYIGNDSGCGSHLSGGTADRCYFTNNTGRAISNLNANDCTVIDSDFGASGGGRTIERCRFIGLKGETASQFSGTDTARMTMRNCLVRNCKATNYNGGHMFVSVDLYNTTVVGTSGGRPGDWNNTVFAKGTVTNCIFADNDACVCSDEIFSQKNASAVTVKNSVYRSGGVTIINSKTLAELEADGTPLKFVGTGDDPYQLKRTSYGVDGGADVGYTDEDTDLLGNPRVVRSAVDLGCYEYMPRIGLLLMVR